MVCKKWGAPLLLASAMAHAGPTLTPDAGMIFPDTNRAGQQHSIDNGLLFGGALGWRFDNGLGAELDLQRSRHLDIKQGDQTVDRLTGTLSSLNGYYIFSQRTSFQPFILAGAGRSRFSADGGSQADETIANVGLGAFVSLSDSIALRGELRDSHVFGSSKHDDMLALLGVQWHIGHQAAAPVVAIIPAAALPAPPSDEDGDGVPDTRDKCAGTPAGVAVNADGCPLDSDGDGDGVSDDKDACPDTFRSSPVDERGCALPLKETVRVDAHFDTNSTVLHPEDKAAIGKIADTAKRYPDASIKVQGFTDSIGSRGANRILSQARADSVRRSLIDDFQVPAASIEAVGYGAAQPVASNKTEAGRAQNRRVMALISASGQMPYVEPEAAVPAKKAVKAPKKKPLAGDKPGKKKLTGGNRCKQVC
jgi:OOP family OmpA-OmpF porin